MKKYCLLTCLICVLMLSACGLGLTNDKSVKIKSSYQEYVQTLGLNELSDLRVKHYEEETKDSLTMIYFNCDEEAAFQELSDKVKAHNVFVKTNPDYFTGDESVSFLYDPGANGLDEGYFVFYSDLRDCYRTIDTVKAERRDLGEDLGRTNDGTFQYMRVELCDCVNNTKCFDNNVKYQVPVVILELDHYTKAPKIEDLAMLGNIEGLQQVVITNYDIQYANEIYDEIQTVVPGTEVFFEEYKTEGRYFTKAQNTN